VHSVPPWLFLPQRHGEHGDSRVLHFRFLCARWFDCRVKNILRAGTFPSNTALSALFVDFLHFVHISALAYFSHFLHGFAVSIMRCSAVIGAHCRKLFGTSPYFAHTAPTWGVGMTQAKCGQDSGKVWARLRQSVGSTQAKCRQHSGKVRAALRHVSY
jgi:hypothetical protein